MKAFLLAAGNGTRLKPLTDSTPKCLLPIRGKPLLGIWLELCKRSGIDEVLINLHAHADVVREYIETSDHGLKVTLFEEPTLLGSAGTIAANRQWVSREKNFWVLYADVLSNIDLDQMLQRHRSKPSPITLSVYAVPNPSQCGVVVLDRDGIVREFVEKPATPSSNLAFSGVLLGGPEMLDAIPERRPADIGFDILPQFVGKMSAHLTGAYFQDIGTPQNYQIAQTTWPGI